MLKELNTYLPGHTNDKCPIPSYADDSLSNGNTNSSIRWRETSIIFSLAIYGRQW